MTNLIQNANWKKIGNGGGPLYFSGSGPVTFDDFYYRGNRTCSVTMANGTASDRYDIPIDVRRCRAIRFGYVIRAVEAKSIMLRADFLDSCGNIVKTEAIPIEGCVTCEFKYQEACVRVPCGAQKIMTSLWFEGKVTACTFGAPFAVYA